MVRFQIGVLGLALSLAACGSSSDAPPCCGGPNAGASGALAAGAPTGGASLGGASAGGAANAGSGYASNAGASGASGASAAAGAGSDMGGALTGGAGGSGGSAGGNSAGAAGGVPVVPAGTAWDSPSTGNPFLPGYFADPSIFYDSTSSTFYVFSTTDGVWIDYSADPAVWSSKDFVNWHAQRLSLPSAWPKQPLWAPSVMRHPTNGNYYLLYAISNATYVARATTPLGPWTNASSNGAPLYQKGEMFGNSDWFDAQFFVDTDATYMTFGGGGQVGIAKLAFAADGSVSIDNSDARMTNGSTHKFKQLTGLSNYLEGSCLFKSGTRYFITYSNGACQNYNVQYAVASSPLGPFTHAGGNIVKRDDTKHVLGPGHNSVLQYDNDTYLVYHRQAYQYVDVKRQVSIDHITINGDTISANVQTQSGVWAGSGALESLVAKARAASELDLAYGKATAASSESDFQGGTSGNIKESFPAIKGFYAGKFAVDNNRGTRWAPTTLPGSLVVDLGRDSAIGRTETTFEYVLRAYHYRIEYLAQAEAADLAAAKASTAWHSYADRSTNTVALPPLVDVNSVTARYLRLTVLSADLPTTASEIRTIVETDFANRVSVVEFKAFQNATAKAQ
ncbi:MAG: family 43 glycosylhydrolase [Myxococcales bacterium]